MTGAGTDRTDAKKILLRLQRLSRIFNFTSTDEMLSHLQPFLSYGFVFLKLGRGAFKNDFSMAHDI